MSILLDTRNKMNQKCLIRMFGTHTSALCWVLERILAIGEAPNMILFSTLKLGSVAGGLKHFGRTLFLFEITDHDSE